MANSIKNGKFHISNLLIIYINYQLFDVIIIIFTQTQTQIFLTNFFSKQNIHINKISSYVDFSWSIPLIVIGDQRVKIYGPTALGQHSWSSVPQSTDSRYCAHCVQSSAFVFSDPCVYKSSRTFSLPFFCLISRSL